MTAAVVTKLNPGPCNEQMAEKQAGATALEANMGSCGAAPQAQKGRRRASLLLMASAATQQELAKQGQSTDALLEQLEALLADSRKVSTQLPAPKRNVIVLEETVPLEDEPEPELPLHVPELPPSTPIAAAKTNVRRQPSRRVSVITMGFGEALPAGKVAGTDGTRHAPNLSRRASTANPLLDTDDILAVDHVRAASASNLSGRMPSFSGSAAPLKNAAMSSMPANNTALPRQPLFTKAPSMCRRGSTLSTALQAAAAAELTSTSDGEGHTSPARRQPSVSAGPTPPQATSSAPLKLAPPISRRASCTATDRGHSMTGARAITPAAARRSSTVMGGTGMVSIATVNSTPIHVPSGMHANSSSLCSISTPVSPEVSASQFMLHTGPQPRAATSQSSRVSFSQDVFMPASLTTTLHSHLSHRSDGFSRPNDTSGCEMYPHISHTTSGCVASHDGSTGAVGGLGRKRAVGRQASFTTSPSRMGAPCEARGPLAGALGPLDALGGKRAGPCTTSSNRPSRTLIDPAAQLDLSAGAPGGSMFIVKPVPDEQPTPTLGAHGKQSHWATPLPTPFAAPAAAPVTASASLPSPCPVLSTSMTSMGLGEQVRGRVSRSGPGSMTASRGPSLSGGAGDLREGSFVAMGSRGVAPGSLSTFTRPGARG